MTVRYYYIFVILLLAACSGGSSSTSGEDKKDTIPSTTAAKELTVGVSTGVTLRSIGVELDPHFFSQNLPLNNGAKTEDWDNIVVKRVKLMGIQSFRVMVLPSWYEPANDNDDPNTINWGGFTFNSTEMQSLYKVLDLAESQKIQVTLNLWGAPRGNFLAGSLSNDWVVFPQNIDEWCENFSALIQYLINTKKYTCIKEITPLNEPNSFSNSSLDYANMCKTLHNRFSKDGIRDRVSFDLSDNTDQGGSHTYLTDCVSYLKDVADVYNSHTYIFGYNTVNSTISNWESLNHQLTKSASKNHFVGEFGSDQCVGSSRQTDINLYERGILMTRIVINLLNGGASGVNYWQLFDQYYSKTDPYSAMQQLGLWKYVKKVYSSETYYSSIKSDYEVRPQYYAYSLLTRFLRSGAEIHPIPTGEDYFAGTAVKNSDGKWVYVFANPTSKEKKISLTNGRGNATGTYQVYRYVKGELPTTDEMINSASQTVSVTDKLTYTVPALSTVLLKQN